MRKSAYSFWFIVFLITVVGALILSAGQARASAKESATAGASTEAHAANPRVIEPLTTPTPTPTRFADLTGALEWQAGTCPTQTLRLTTHLDIVLGQGIGSTTMRLSNDGGDYLDFAVPPLNYHPYANTYIYDCVVGSCIPPAWLSSLPFTLTVDFQDQVPEYNESNNNAYQYDQPCGTITVTPTPTNTSSPTPTNTPCALTFTDVNPPDYFYEAVMYLACHGVISGYSDGTFRPYNDTTRGQLSKIVVLAEGWPITTPTGSPTFQDVPAGNPFYAYVETAYARGIISGDSCGVGCLEFRWANNITRGQLTKVIVLAQNWTITPPGTPTFIDVPLEHPFFGYIETAYARGVISGYSCGTGCLEFRPGSNATRGQIAKIVYNAVGPPVR